MFPQLHLLRGCGNINLKPGVISHVISRSLLEGKCGREIEAK